MGDWKEEVEKEISQLNERLRALIERTDRERKGKAYLDFDSFEEIIKVGSQIEALEMLKLKMGARS